MWRLSSIVALLLLAFSGSGFAAGDKPEFEKVDTNDDGRISLDEAKERNVPVKEFKAADTDENGKLAKTDWWLVEMNPSDNVS